MLRNLALSGSSISILKAQLRKILNTCNISRIFAFCILKFMN